MAMTDQQTLNVEATKLVKEWSVWMVAVQSALVGFLATAAKTQSGIHEFTVQVALICFVISVLAAAWVLSALPYVLIRLLEEEDQNIYFMNLSSAPLLKHIPVWLMGAIQHWAFAVGLLFLVGGRVFYGNA
jgi:hypothetical protein